jgi:hypothetical protein
LFPSNVLISQGHRVRKNSDVGNGHYVHLMKSLYTFLQLITALLNGAISTSESTGCQIIVKMILNGEKGGFGSDLCEGTVPEFACRH